MSLFVITTSSPQIVSAQEPAPANLRLRTTLPQITLCKFEWIKHGDWSDERLKVTVVPIGWLYSLESGRMCGIDTSSKQRRYHDDNYRFGALLVFNGPSRCVWQRGRQWDLSCKYWQLDYNFHYWRVWMWVTRLHPAICPWLRHSISLCLWEKTIIFHTNGHQDTYNTHNTPKIHLKYPIIHW